VSEIEFKEEYQPSRALNVLRRCVSRNNLAHGLLLTGENLATLEREALILAGDLLKPLSRPASPDHPVGHPDLFHLRPGKKMRLIPVDATRELIRQIYQTSNQGGNKVAIIHEADRFNVESANAFLKSLEEPPKGTYLILLSTHLYRILPTLRSRCFCLPVHSQVPPIANESWQQWSEDYKNWLGGLLNLRNGGKPAVSEAMFGLYGLLTRFEVIQAEIVKDSLAETESDETLSGDESLAQEARIQRGTTLRLIRDIEQATRDFALDISRFETYPNLPRKFIHSTETLEQLPGLLRLNLKDISALEFFMLKTLRLWSA
jgi:DNA polymerase-3 subunit delta'